MGATGMVGQEVSRRLRVLGSKCWGLYRKSRKEGEPLFIPQFESKINKTYLPPASECFERMFALDQEGKSKE
jgi:NAD dependent epimerase/dehydratase family enzyme